MIRNVLKTPGLLRTAVAASAALPFLVAASAFAQTTPNAPIQGGEATTARVIVTGSYIPTAETESALPVTVYTAEVLQKQGANTPIEGLRQLPSFVGNAPTETNSNGGDGSAFINLRALGVGNTLVLVNGRRTFNFNDINAISLGAVSRTEVLKDGASAVYGSDAVAGVVNFILLDGPGEAPYEGAEIFGLYGNTTDTDSHVRQVYIKGGVKTDKVSIAAAGEYYSRANLYAHDRPILSRTGDLSNSQGDPFRPNSSGMQRNGLNNDSQTFAGRVSVKVKVPGSSATQLVIVDPTNNAPIPNSGGAPNAYRKFTPGADPAGFNFLAFAPAIPALEKAMYYVTGRYKIFGEGLQIYGDIMYTKSKQDNGLAGSPFTMSNAFNGGNEARASKFNPFGNNLASVRYRLEGELGNRRTLYDKDYYRYVAGLNGDFNFKDNGFISHFGYDTGLVYERLDELNTDSGDARRSFLRAQIAPVGFTNPLAPLPTAATGLFDPFIGQSAPKVGVAPTYVNGVPTGLTAPYNNILGAQNARFLGRSTFYERDQLYDAKINAHLFPNLWNGGVDLAVGYEHREIAQHNIPDPVEATNDPLGFSGAAITKTRQIADSVFVELGLPIVTSAMNIPFIRSLDLDIAWRYEKFKDRNLFATDPTKRDASFDNVNQDENFGGTPRVSLRYQPIADLTVRASWGQSFLSPSPTQLFSPIVQDFPVLFDPAPGQKITLQPPDGVFRGGNANLKPEETDTYTAGLVYTPKWLPGFTTTVDFYQVFTRNLILGGNDFAQVLLTNNVVDPDGCGNGGGGAAQPGGTALGITRFPDGSLDCIDSVVGNAGKRLVEGMDLTAAYEIPTQHFGTFTLSLGWNHFFIWKAEPGVGGTHNFLGDFSQAFPLTPGAIPFNKGYLRGEWQGPSGWLKGFDFVATMTYIGDFEDDPNFIAGNDLVPGSPGTGNIPPSNNPSFMFHHRVSAYETLDLQLSYEFLKPEMPAAAGYSKDAKDAKSMGKEVAGVENSSIWQRMLWNTKITVGANNVFDRLPPTELGAFNDNYDTNLYSERGRYWYVSLTKKF